MIQQTVEKYIELRKLKANIKEMEGQVSQHESQLSKRDEVMQAFKMK